MSKAVILGGGLSGLSTAYYLARSSKFKQILLLEASGRLGGWANTVKFNDGTLFELGPRSFRPMENAGFNTLQLAEELGLSERIIGVPSDNPAAKNRYLYVNNSIHKLNLSPTAWFTTQPPFKKPMFKSIMGEFARPSPALEDESIHSFVSRRLGPELGDIAFNAMYRGIFAGDVKKLSIRSCLAVLYNAEQQYGSITKGMIQKMRTAKEASLENQHLNSNLRTKAKRNKWRMWTLQEGISELVQSMEEAVLKTGKVQIYKNINCTGLNFTQDGAKVKTEKEIISADHVISSIFAKDLSLILPPEQQQLSTLLNQISAVSTVVVNLEFEGQLLKHTGFGHLLPSTEDGPTLGVIYDSSAFPEHDRTGATTTRLTVMLGGAWFDELEGRLKGQFDDNTVTSYTLNILKHHLNITDKPSKVKVSVLKECIPQYEVGHYKKLNDIFEHIKTTNLPLTLVGSSYKGVSTNDCIYNARLAVEELCSI